MSSKATPPGQDEAEVLDLLEGLGFSATEAKVYTALAAQRDATAYELAKRTQIARATVYSAVSNLAQQGAIQQIVDAPARYVLSEPARFFAQRVDEARLKSETVVDALHHWGPLAHDEYVTHLRGGKAVSDAVVSMLEAAQSNVFLKTVGTIAEPFFDVLSARATSGVDIVAVASGDEWARLDGHENIRIVPHEATGSIPSDAHHVLLTMTADVNRMLIASYAEPARAFVTTQPSVVYVVQTTILHEIYLSEIMQAIGPEALAAAGVSLSDLRRRFRPENLGKVIFE